MTPTSARATADARAFARKRSGSRSAFRLLVLAYFVYIFFAFDLPGLRPARTRLRQRARS